MHRDLSQIERVSDFLFQFCHFIETNKSIQILAATLKSPVASLTDQKSDGLAVDLQPGVHMVNQKPDWPDVLAVDMPGVPGAMYKPEQLEKQQLEKPLLAGEHLRLPEEVPESLPLDCILVNNPETAVNYHKDGCLLIGDTRRPTPPACIRKVLKSRILNDRLAKNASRYRSRLLIAGFTCTQP